MIQLDAETDDFLASVTVRDSATQAQLVAAFAHRDDLVKYRNELYAELHKVSALLDGAEDSETVIKAFRGKPVRRETKHVHTGGFLYREVSMSDKERGLIELSWKRNRSDHKRGHCHVNNADAKWCPRSKKLICKTHCNPPSGGWTFYDKPLSVSDIKGFGKRVDSSATPKGFSDRECPGTWWHCVVENVTQDEARELAKAWLDHPYDGYPDGAVLRHWVG